MFKQPKKQTRQVVQQSAAFYTNIPKRIAQILGLKKGDEVTVSYDPERRVIVVKPN